MNTETTPRAEWFYDRYDPNCPQWKVKIPSSKPGYDYQTIKVGDIVTVTVGNRSQQGHVKQVAGFGAQEHRPVISVRFPGKSKGTKVDISNVTKP